MLMWGYTGLSRVWKKSYNRGHPPGGLSVFIHDNIKQGIKDIEISIVTNL
jgi:hypothetical protein